LGKGRGAAAGERAGAKLELRTDPKPDAKWSGERPMNIIEYQPLPLFPYRSAIKC